MVYRDNANPPSGPGGPPKRPPFDPRRWVKNNQSTIDDYTRALLGNQPLTYRLKGKIADEIINSFHADRGETVKGTLRNLLVNTAIRIPEPKGSGAAESLSEAIQVLDGEDESWRQRLQSMWSGRAKAAPAASTAAAASTKSAPRQGQRGTSTVTQKWMEKNQGKLLSQTKNVLMSHAWQLGWDGARMFVRDEASREALLLSSCEQAISTVASADKEIDPAKVATGAKTFGPVLKGWLSTATKSMVTIATSVASAVFGQMGESESENGWDLAIRRPAGSRGLSPQHAGAARKRIRAAAAPAFASALDRAVDADLLTQFVARRPGGVDARKLRAAFADAANRAFAAEFVRLVGGQPPASAEDIALGAIIAVAIAQTTARYPIVPPAAVAPMAVLVHRTLRSRLAELARMAAVIAAAPPAGPASRPAAPARELAW